MTNGDYLCAGRLIELVKVSFSVQSAILPLVCVLERTFISEFQK